MARTNWTAGWDEENKPSAASANGTQTRAYQEGAGARRTTNKSGTGSKKTNTDSFLTKARTNGYIAQARKQGQEFMDNVKRNNPSGYRGKVRSRAMADSLRKSIDNDPNRLDEIPQSVRDRVNREVQHNW